VQRGGFLDVLQHSLESMKPILNLDTHRSILVMEHPTPVCRGKELRGLIGLLFFHLIFFLVFFVLFVWLMLIFVICSGGRGGRRRCLHKRHHKHHPRLSFISICTFQSPGGSRLSVSAWPRIEDQHNPLLHFRLFSSFFFSSLFSFLSSRSTSLQIRERI